MTVSPPATLAELSAAVALSSSCSSVPFGSSRTCFARRGSLACTTVIFLGFAHSATRGMPMPRTDREHRKMSPGLRSRRQQSADGGRAVAFWLLALPGHST